MNTAKSFTSLIAWQKSHLFLVELYTVTKKFPREELYSLTDQLRRAGVSITSNLAEGFGRQSKKEKVQFYFLSLGEQWCTASSLRAHVPHRVLSWFRFGGWSDVSEKLPNLFRAARSDHHLPVRSV